MKLTIILLVSIALLSACNNQPDSANSVNNKASLPSAFNFSKLGLKVIASFINKKQRTMSTLYGNDLALNTATSGTKIIPAGETLSLVTWEQQEDEHWIGAKIPGDLLSVEMVKTIPSDNGVAVIKYQRYEGKSLVLNADTLHQSERIKFIFGQKPSITP